ncbi:hypothetical protein CVS40_4718 [Lucilia cuprina]|nr:hypothetical protein CVS40_4718 [Lucilia cuprina]
MVLGQATIAKMHNMEKLKTEENHRVFRLAKVHTRFGEKPNVNSGYGNYSTKNRPSNIFATMKEEYTGKKQNKNRFGKLTSLTLRHLKYRKKFMIYVANKTSN